MINFEIIGECVAKGRPRFTKTEDTVLVHSDKKTSSYENLVKIFFLRSKATPYGNKEALICEIDVYKAIPKSTSQKKRALMLEGKIQPTTKPDCDNYIKSILDALNKVAYYDDSQIVRVVCEKHYSEYPKTVVKIYSKEEKMNEQ